MSLFDTLPYEIIYIIIDYSTDFEDVYNLTLNIKLNNQSFLKGLFVSKFPRISKMFDYKLPLQYLLACYFRSIRVYEFVLKNVSNVENVICMILGADHSVGDVNPDLSYGGYTKQFSLYFYKEFNYQSTNTFLIKILCKYFDFSEKVDMNKFVNGNDIMIDLSIRPAGYYIDIFKMSSKIKREDFIDILFVLIYNTNIDKLN